MSANLQNTEIIGDLSKRR